MSAKNIQFTKLELLLAVYLFKHYRERHTARQLARILGINHAHVNKLCNDLVGKNLLTREAVSNSVLFSFDYGNSLARGFMGYLVGLEKEKIPKWLSVVSHNLEKFSPFIQMGLIFGSSIKDNTFNDVDVLLLYDKKKASDVRRIKAAIRASRLVEQPIRYVDITEKDLIANKDSDIFYAILSDCLVFCGAQQYVKVIQKCRRSTIT